MNDKIIKRVSEAQKRITLGKLENTIYYVGAPRNATFITPSLFGRRHVDTYLLLTYYFGKVDALNRSTNNTMGNKG